MLSDSSNIEEQSDSQLVLASLANPESFSAIIKRYERPLFLYISRISNVSSDECEDILQEVFINCYLNLNDYNSDLKFSSWLYRIAHNQAISHYRKLKARPEGHMLSIDDNEAMDLASGLDIELDIDVSLNRESISSILSALDKKHREILVLKFLEEKSYQEISDIIKKPLGTVASSINRAKSAFKEEFNRQAIKL